MATAKLLQNLADRACTVTLKSNDYKMKYLIDLLADQQ
jgi:hypothetical protein